MIKHSFLFLCLALFTYSSAFSQIMMSSDFNAAGSGTIVASYTYKGYTEFWAGEAKMMAPQEGLNQSIGSIYAQYAFSNRVEVAANIPYIYNNSKTGEQTFKGLQDISLFIKGKIYEAKAFTTGLALGTNIATGYNPQGLYSLGNGSSSVDGLVLLKYKTPVGLSIGAQGGYSIRLDEGVPNAALLVTSVAYSHKHFYLKAAYGLQRSVEGLDIGSPGFEVPVDFPRAKVDYDQIMLSAFVPLTDSFGLTAAGGTAVDGRNMGDFSYISLGLAMSWK